MFPVLSLYSVYGVREIGLKFGLWDFASTIYTSSNNGQISIGYRTKYLSSLVWCYSSRTRTVRNRVLLTGVWLTPKTV